MSTNLTMFRGDTKIVQITVTGLPGGGLQGYKFWFTAKNNYSDADASAVIQKTGNPGPGFTIVTMGNQTTPGLVTCKINAADTAGLADNPTSLYFDVQLEDAGGNVTTVASGTLSITQDVTESY